MVAAGNITNNTGEGTISLGNTTDETEARISGIDELNLPRSEERYGIDIKGVTKLFIIEGNYSGSGLSDHQTFMQSIRTIVDGEQDDLHRYYTTMLGGTKDDSSYTNIKILKYEFKRAGGNATYIHYKMWLGQFTKGV